MKDNIPLISESLFVNLNGQLCVTFSLFGKPRYTKIHVQPVFDGYDTQGRIIVKDDWSYILS